MKPKCIQKPTYTQAVIQERKSIKRFIDFAYEHQARMNEFGIALGFKPEKVRMGAFPTNNWRKNGFITIEERKHVMNGGNITP